MCYAALGTLFGFDLRRFSLGCADENWNYFRAVESPALTQPTNLRLNFAINVREGRERPVDVRVFGIEHYVFRFFP